MLLSRTMRRLLLYFSLPTAFAIVFICFLPNFLSHFGRSILYSVIRKDTGLVIQAEQFNCSWLGKQTLSHVHVAFPDGSKELVAESIEVDSSLIRMIMKIHPRGVLIKNWELSVDESQKMPLETPAHIPTHRLFPLSKMNLLSENGSIKYKISNEKILSASRVYLKKDCNSLILKAATKLNNTVGNISINASISPYVQLDSEIESFPLAFLTLITTSDIAAHAFKSEDLINISSKTSHAQNDNKSLTLTLTTSKSKLLLKGGISNSILTLEVTSPAKIDINEQLTTHLLHPFFPCSEKISSSYLSLNTLFLQIPLQISEFHKTVGHAEFETQSIRFTQSNPALSFSLENVQTHLEKKSDSSSLKISATNVMKSASSRIEFQSEYSSETGKHLFSLQHAGIPHSYLSEVFPIFSSLKSSSFSEYILKTRGEYYLGKIEAQTVLENSLLHISLDSYGNLDLMNFEGQGQYTLPEHITQNVSFNTVDIAISGKLQFVNNHIFFPKFYSKISADHNEINIHARLGKNDLPISTEHSALLVHGILSDLPIGFIRPEFQDLKIQDATFSFHSEDSKLSAKGNLKATLIDDNLPKSQTIRIVFPEIIVTADKDPDKEYQRLLTKESSWVFSGDIHSISIPTLCKIIRTPNLSRYLGHEGSINIHGNYMPKSDDLWTITSTIKTDSLDANLSLSIDHNLKFTEKTQGKIYWEITPERYLSFFDNASCKPLCALHRSASIQLNISKISCPTASSGITCLSLLQGAIEGELSTSSMIFYDKSYKESFIINPISGNIHSSKDSDSVSYEISGSCISSKQDPKNPSKFFIKGSLSSILSEKNQHFSQVAKWINIPSTFITGIFPISPSVKAQITSLAGAFINISIVHNLIQNEGPIIISIDSSNLKTDIPLVITDKALLLGNTLKAELYINDEVNKAFLQEFNPLLSQGGARSEEPITLVVEKNGFYLPIRPYSFPEFKIENAELDLKKVYIENRGDIKELFSFLGITEKKDSVEAWFTPIFFSVDKGAIHCKRFDALIDKKIRAALWGKTDLANDRIYMTLGLDPEVIKKYFRNTHLKTKNFFLIKIRGSISSPKADWSSAYARIGLLKNNSIGNPIISNLADKIFSSLGDSTPPQTTHPLPWEQERNTSRRPRTEEKPHKHNRSRRK